MERILKFLGAFERYIVLALLAMLMLAVFLSTLELGVILVEQLLDPPRRFLLDLGDITTIFGFFLMVLLGLELLETVKIYLQERQFHVEIVLIVAMIAVARKIIVLDYESTPPQMLLSIAATMVALSVGYYLIQRTISKNRV